VLVRVERLAQAAMTQAATARQHFPISECGSSGESTGATREGYELPGGALGLSRDSMELVFPFIWLIRAINIPYRWMALCCPR